MICSVWFELFWLIFDMSWFDDILSRLWYTALAFSLLVDDDITKTTVKDVQSISHNICFLEMKPLELYNSYLVVVMGSCLKHIKNTFNMKNGIMQAHMILIKIKSTKGNFCDHVNNTDTNLELTVPKNSQFLCFPSLCSL